MWEETRDKLRQFMLTIEAEGDFMILEDEELNELESCIYCGKTSLIKHATRIYPNDEMSFLVNGKACPSCGRLYMPFRGTVEAIVAGVSDIPEWFAGKTFSYRNHRLEIERTSDKLLREREERKQKQLKQDVINSSIKKPASPKKNSSAASYDQDDLSIRKNIFLLKKHTFSCDKAGHEIERVDAKIDILDKRTANPRVKTIPAGYCRQCRKYFVLMSDYEDLLEVGVPLCNVVNVEEHGKKQAMNGKYHLQEESILMQHGYNVNAQANLSSATRQRLLGLLIDYEICPRLKIVSYLDYFVRQRQHMSNMENAISKWKEDRAFVQNYKKGTAREVWVREIRKYR